MDISDHFDPFFIYAGFSNSVSSKHYFFSNLILFFRYLLYIYPVLCSPIITKSSHVVPSKVMERKRLKFDIQLQVKDRFDILAPMISNSRLEFPETRLVQYDCGM